jgi:hypothetical protein
MTKLWVQLKQLNPSRVSTDGCSDVDDFLKACKKELPQHFEQYEVTEMSLSSSDCTFLPDDALPEQNTRATAYVITVEHPIGIF